MSVPFSQRVNAKPKIRQTLIDLRAFFLSRACRSSLSDPLTSCQVDEVQTAFLLGAIWVDLLVIDHKDRVAARAPIVLLSRGYLTRTLSVDQRDEDIIEG